MSETETSRKWMYGLTADEWLHLAGEGDNSEVQPCCGDISELRDFLGALATSQGPGESHNFYTAVFESYEAAAASHDVLADAAKFPLLHRVLDGMRQEHTEWQEEIRQYRAGFAAKDSTSDSPQAQP